MKKYIQITAGRGPVECARVVFLVFKKLYKLFSGIDVVDCEKHNTEDNCYMSVVLSKDFSDDEIAELKNNWIGTIQYIATKNTYRPNHKRRNWFVGINMIDPVELPEIKESDIVYESCRAGGNGGQNVNKVETSVRAVYKPTGLSVKCSDERSQFQNKFRARERLLLKLAEIGENRINQQKNDVWSKHTEIERGNPVQTFKGEL